jgi:hypothetical protein
MELLIQNCLFAQDEKKELVIFSSGSWHILNCISPMYYGLIFQKRTLPKLCNGLPAVSGVLVKPVSKF